MIGTDPCASGFLHVLAASFDGRRRWVKGSEAENSQRELFGSP